MKQHESTSKLAIERATQRAGSLIDAMLCELEAVIQQPERLQSTEWGMLFGTKQTVAETLQKLVQSLASLAEQRAKKMNASLKEPEATTMNAEDIKILCEWLREERKSRS